MAIGTTAAILGSAVIGAGASMAGAGAASSAAKKAAAENARIQQQQYEQTRADLAPYNQAGQSALNTLSGRVNSGPDMDGRAYVRGNADVLEAYNQPGVREAWGGDEDAYGEAHYGSSGRDEGREMGYEPGPLDEWSERPTGSPRPDFGEAPDFGAAPDASSYFTGYEPTEQYRNELERTTRGLNAKAGMGGGYFSGGRGLALQENADRLYQADYGNWWNRQNTLYQTALGQFNTQKAAGLGQYNATRNFLNSNYDVDTSRGDARFDTDRGYATGRQDQQTQNLFGLAGMGANAAGAQAGAGQNYANNVSANNNSAASATGNAAIYGANSVNNLLGQGIQAYGLYKGGQAYGGSPQNILSGRTPEYSLYG